MDRATPIEHDAEHGADLDVDCPLCRADAEALGMGELLPKERDYTIVTDDATPVVIAEVRHIGLS